jgi:protein MpaA
MDHLSQNEGLMRDRRLLIIPVANPDGYAENVRHNLRGIDLNRNFPADNWQTADRHGDAALSEPESAALHRVLENARPTRIISIHQPLVCIDYDGPGERVAEAMSAECHLPVKRLGGRPGSLGSYAGETLKIPIITVELPEDASGLKADALWDSYGRMLLAGISFPQPLDVRAAEASTLR